jgi:hypothetical protein
MHPWQQHLESPTAGFLPPGVADADTLTSISGLEFLQRMIRREIPVPPITDTLDFHLHSQGTTPCMMFDLQS